MDKMNAADWQAICRAVITIATILLGALGAQEATDED